MHHAHAALTIDDTAQLFSERSGKHEFTSSMARKAIRPYVVSSALALLDLTTYSHRDYAGNTGCPDLCDIVIGHLGKVERDIAQRIAHPIHQYFTKHLLEEPVVYRYAPPLDAFHAGLKDELDQEEMKFRAREMQPLEPGERRDLSIWKARIAKMRRIYEAVPPDENGHRLLPYRLLWKPKPRVEEMLQHLDDRQLDDYARRLAWGIMSSSPDYFAHFGARLLGKELEADATTRRCTDIFRPK